MLGTLVLSVTPIRWLGWLGEFASVTRTIVGPVSHPVSWVGRRLRSAPFLEARPEALVQLERERDHYRFLYEQQIARNENLLRQIEELQKGFLVSTDQPLRQLTVPVTGSSSDASSRVLIVRAGRAQGVHENAVAVTDGVQLVGTVVRADQRSSLVKPITDPSAGLIEAQVMVGDGVGIPCALSPQHDAVLKGPLGEVPSGTPQPQIGDLVRLRDGTWPAHAQSLVVGAVAALEPSKDTPLRLIVTVRPTVDVTLVSEVVLRIIDEGAP